MKSRIESLKDDSLREVPKGYLSVKEIAAELNLGERAARERVDAMVRSKQICRVSVLINARHAYYYGEAKTKNS